MGGFVHFFINAQLHLNNGFPLITPYGRASIMVAGEPVITHSDCGEHALLYLILLATYNEQTGDYELTRWMKRVQDYKLKPYKRSFENDDVITEFIQCGSTQASANQNSIMAKRSALINCLSKTHDDWSNIVMSRLNVPSAYTINDKNKAMIYSEKKKILYTKPSSAPVCKIKPSIDNVLNVFERVLGDFQ